MSDDVRNHRATYEEREAVAVKALLKAQKILRGAAVPDENYSRPALVRAILRAAVAIKETVDKEEKRLCKLHGGGVYVAVRQFDILASAVCVPDRTTRPYSVGGEKLVAFAAAAVLMQEASNYQLALDVLTPTGNELAAHIIPLVSNKADCG